MTDSLDTAIAEVARVLDDTSDPAERFQRLREATAKVDSAFKGVQQRIALQLKEHMTWREVGEIMGGVTAQRAEQMSRGAR